METIQETDRMAIINRLIAILSTLKPPITDDKAKALAQTLEARAYHSVTSKDQYILHIQSQVSLLRNEQMTIRMTPASLSDEQKSFVILKIKDMAPMYRSIPSWIDSLHLYGSEKELDMIKKLEGMKRMMEAQLEGFQSNVYYLTPDTVSQLQQNLLRFFHYSENLKNQKQGCNSSTPTIGQMQFTPASPMARPSLLNQQQLNQQNLVAQLHQQQAFMHQQLLQQSPQISHQLLQRSATGLPATSPLISASSLKPTQSNGPSPPQMSPESTPSILPQSTSPPKPSPRQAPQSLPSGSPMINQMSSPALSNSHLNQQQLMMQQMMQQQHHYQQQMMLQQHQARLMQQQGGRPMMNALGLNGMSLTPQQQQQLQMHYLQQQQQQALMQQQFIQQQLMSGQMGQQNPLGQALQDGLTLALNQTKPVAENSKADDWADDLALFGGDLVKPQETVIKKEAPAIKIETDTHEEGTLN